MNINQLLHIKGDRLYIAVNPNQDDLLGLMRDLSEATDLNELETFIRLTKEEPELFDPAPSRKEVEELFLAGETQTLFFFEDFSHGLDDWWSLILFLPERKEVKS